jgi:hypothetical protein
MLFLEILCRQLKIVFHQKKCFRQNIFSTAENTKKIVNFFLKIRSNSVLRFPFIISDL